MAQFLQLFFLTRKGPGQTSVSIIMGKNLTLSRPFLRYSRANKSPNWPKRLKIFGVISVYGGNGMGTQKTRLKGIPKNELKARLAVKRAKNLWHFGPKRMDPHGRVEPVDSMVQRLRFG
jgi:hypothetical protein